jgi:DNA-binding NtrC family response regulator
VSGVPCWTSRRVDELILGVSPSIRRLRGLIERVAASALPVTIEGPTGAGKELVAQSLHLASGRSGRNVAFNVCAVADAMLEDALFGHVRGAFTGALSDRAGFLEEADGGTLFLDEVGGMPIGAQAKLLRALETGVFRPVGGRSDHRSDFRLVAATNMPLAELVARGEFRPDLSFRLAGFTLTVPPLRDRMEDLPALVEHFVRALDPSGRTRLALGALAVFRGYHWPGNVRELRHVVERSMLLATTPLVGAEPARAALQVAVSRTQRPHREFTERRLRTVLELNGWDVAATARALGVHRATVYRRLKRLAISPAEAARDLAFRPDRTRDPTSSVVRERPTLLGD